MMKKDRVFQDGYVYVFSKKKYLNKQSKNSHNRNRCKNSWQNECNGQIVKILDDYTGCILNYGISSAWCKAIRRVK